MHQLWENPKSIATILLNANNNELIKNLAPFIVHNLYDNISLNHKDDQLIYIMTLLLKDEINSINNLSKSPIHLLKCSIIFEEFSKKIEVKSFFKNIILDVIEKLENTYSYLNITFDPNAINEIYEEFLKDKKEEPIYSNEINANFHKNQKIEKWKLITDKYINIPFNEEQLNKKLNEYTDKDMQDFIQRTILEVKSSPEKYLNKNIFNNIQNKDKQEAIKNYYINSFIQAIDLIDLLFDNLIKNYDLLPYSIRCFSKIISLLINKKFPNEKKIEKNKIISSFFFINLFFPIITNLPLSAFINEINISKPIYKTINVVMSLLYNITLGVLISQTNIASFNWYMIEKMPKLFEFFNIINKVSLPPFIEKLINNELPENYEYDYFKENPDEKLIYRNICYNIDELYCLVTNAEKCKDDISINEKVLSKFRKNKEILTEIKNNIGHQDINIDNIRDSMKFKKTVYYFLLTDSINNKKFDKKFNLDTYKKNHFNLEELKEIESEEEKIENIKIKIKNFFFDLLYNYETLNKNNFNNENLGNIINILKELKRQSYKILFNLDQDYIPSNWYIKSLIEYLPKLPEDYVENDYKKLLDELQNDIMNSLKEIKFEELEKHIEYLKELDKEKVFYNNIKNIINDIEINQIAFNFIEENRVTFKLKSEDKSAQFLIQIMKEDEEFSNIFYKEDKYYTNSIETFILNFPNLAKYQTNLHIDIFDLLKKKKVDEIIKNYLLLVRNDLNKYKNVNESNLNEIYNKIYDYIMEKLHSHLYPKRQLFNDQEIYRNSCEHIWIEFHNLIKQDKNYIFDTFLPDSIRYINQFEKEKSPRKKILSLQNLFKCIRDLGKFNGDKIEGLDSVFPLLNFTCIKSKPERMYSNLKYVELFLGNNKNGIEDNYLSRISAACKVIMNLSFEDLFNITESDYEEKCTLAYKGILY